MDGWEGREELHRLEQERMREKMNYGDSMPEEAEEAEEELRRMRKIRKRLK